MRKYTTVKYDPRVPQCRVICALPTSVALPSVWILATGEWNDAGVWDDTAFWIDV